MTESKQQTNKLNVSEQEQESSPAKLNRRQFIGFGASAAATAALAFPKSAQAVYKGMPGMPPKARGVAQNSKIILPTIPQLNPPSDSSFYQPDVISSLKLSDNYGTLESSLDIAMETYPSGSSTYIRRFNVTEVSDAAFQTKDTNFIFKPGPTLCVNPGDKISLNVTNTLPTESNYCPPNGNPKSLIPPVTGVGNTPGCFNTTNLHFHGLHVSPLSVDINGSPVSAGDPPPSGRKLARTAPGGMDHIAKSSDDVLYVLGANNQTNEYCPWLPAFHAPGTHWYHSHHHGSTALQVADGLVGALIIKEPEGQEVCPGAPDVVMLMQEQPEPLTNEDEYVVRLTAQDKLDRGVYERTGNATDSNKNNIGGTYLINGVENPTLNLKKGEIQRWRMINASATPRAFTLLQLTLDDGTPFIPGEPGKPDTPATPGTPVPWYRIAIDGITLYGKQMNDPSVLFAAGSDGVPFAPGNRVDFLVDLPPGMYKLWKLKDKNNSTASKKAGDQVLATIKVKDGEEGEYEHKVQVAASFSKLFRYGIPTEGKPEYLRDMPVYGDNDGITFNETPVVFQVSNLTPENQLTTAGRGDFRITNSKFNPNNLANIEADLGSTQEWIVANVTSAKSAAHPFHIHVNPFKVVAIAEIPGAGQPSEPPSSDLNGLTVPKGTGPTDSSVASQQAMYNTLTNLSWEPTSTAANGIDPDIWWDTFTIPKDTAVKIRHRFDDYWGTYVLHCHILIHEDQGMMWAVKVNNVDDKGANPCVQLETPVDMTT